MPKRIKPGMDRVYGGRRIMRVISQVESARLVREGKAVELYSNGVFMGVQLQVYRDVAASRTKAKAAAKSAQYSVLQDADARRSCVVLSRAEVESLADRSVSRTAGLPFTSPKRDARIALGLREMDLAESARVKFDAMFPRYAESHSAARRVEAGLASA